MASDKPLDGIRILDLSQVAAGPICTSYLGAMGADVIKVERPDTGDIARKTPPYAGASGVNAVKTEDREISTTVLKRNRNKRGIAVDLQSDEGYAILMRLIRQSDVVVENFRPGVTKKLGLNWDVLKNVKPSLVYCSISGFGTSGPYKDWVAFDTLIQGMTGVMAGTGFPDNPPTKTGLLVADVFASLFAAPAILAALRQRDRTGQGQCIEVSMFDCLVATMWDEPVEYYAEAGFPSRAGNRIARMAPWNSYAAADGWVVICAGQPPHWSALCAVMGRPDLKDDPRFVTLEARVANVDALDAEVRQWTSTRSREQIARDCQAAHIPCGPVNELPDLIDNPHLKARNLLRPLLHPLYGPVQGASAVAYPVRFSGFDASAETAAPSLGQHTDSVLSALGFSEEELQSLSDRKIIKRSPQMAKQSPGFTGELQK